MSLRFLAPVAAVLIFSGVSFGIEPNKDSPIDFNRDIRPLLAKNCFKCHGPDENHREGGLRLDEPQSALAEAESGAIAVVPGKVDESELFQRIVTDDADLKMPPEGSGGKIEPEQIALIRRWIEEGSPFARHWSFSPPVRHMLPEVKNKDWPTGPLDHFVLARLEAAGIAPSPVADRYTLIRRLSLDLRGLPPTLAEVDAFVTDKRTDAYERLVDQFLKDHAFGERWAGMWLDLARYADSKGYGSDPLRTIWLYRDWVIKAFNRNLPYDQFTIEQLAGDLLPNATIDQKIATAFHRNTMTNTEGGTDDEEFRTEAVKDRIDTTMQVWMGLTFGCGKCHSHKFDPVSHREYYQFFALFNQTADNDQPSDAPLLTARTPEYLAQIKAIDQQIAKLKQQQAKATKPATLLDTAGKPLAGRFVRIELPGNGKLLSLAEVQILSGKENVALKGKASQSSVDYEGPAHLAIDGKTDGDYYKAKSTTHTKTENNPWWEVDLGAVNKIDRIVVWNRTDNKLQSRLSNWRLTVLDDQRKPLLQQNVAAAPNPSSDFPQAGDKALLDRIARLEKSKPTAPTVPVLEELSADKLRKTYILVKGNFLNKGDIVEAALPVAFHKPSADLPMNRLGAARWLVDKSNPLTARVAVNRFWAQLFGQGIVETEEDFGTQGTLPSHPALLDYLALEFMDGNWDIKRILKTIVMSQTYRQASIVTPLHLDKDPRNLLYSRGPRPRLSAEMVRDQALSLSGLLSRKMYGPSVYPPQPAGLWRAAFNGRDRNWKTSPGEDRYRRGLYTFWRRTIPYPSMAAFDAPSREICNVRRIHTNTPLQAFVTMNDPVYVEAAQALARRIVREGGDTPQSRAAYALKLCLVRPPRDDQVRHLVALYESELEHYGKNATDAVSMATVPLGPLPEGMNAKELASWTVVANVLLNLDAVLTKG